MSPFKIKYHNLIVTKDGKGSCLVVMDNVNYVCKVKEFLFVD